MEFTYRKATLNDVDALEALIQQASVMIDRSDYSDRAVEAGLAHIWTVDYHLIQDQTYWIVENDQGMAVGCGGWSDRKLFYGRHMEEHEKDERLTPGIDSARIRAFFVHRDFTRKGIGKTLLEKCEAEAREQGFDSCELVATPSGEKLYAKMGYIVVKEHEIDLGNGISNKVVTMFKMINKREIPTARKVNSILKKAIILMILFFVLYKMGVI
ncbi:GNAT family N-acetyltransferase [Flavobacteriaceae bacterium F08102]|nr:GNAT family N-acetyltransferase [Flavobacteriaceae bacterium F08102]